MNCKNSNLIKKISSILNIHEERVIIKNCILNQNELTTDSIPLGEYVFINNKDDGTLTRIYSFTDDLDELNKSNSEILIIQDIIYSDIVAQNKKIKELKLEKESFIRVINDKYIVNSKLCEDTIDYLEKIIKNEPNIIETEKWESGQNVNAKYITSNYVEKNNPALFNRINMCYTKILSELHSTNYSSFRRPGNHKNTFTIRKIYGPTRNHADGLFNDGTNKKELRDLSCIINLNNNYTGGDFIFEKQDFKYKMKKNDIIVFPPYYTHPHLTLPLEDMTYRYTINTWFLV